MPEDKWIDRINALIAKANATSFAEERQTYLDKVDELVLKFSIDRARLAANPGVQQQESVKIEFWSMPYTEFSQQTAELFHVVMNYCSLRWNYDGWDGHARKIKVVGFDTDQAQAQMLWTIVYREFAGNLWPAWKADASFDENVYAYVKGGYKWKAIALEATENGVEVSWPDGGRLKRAYQRACRANGEEPTAHTQRHGAFRASYASAFSATVRSRLAEMRRRTQESQDEETRGQFKLAVISNTERVNREFYRLYPQYDPEVIARRQQESAEAERARREAMTEEERKAEDAANEKQYQKDLKWYRSHKDTSYDVNGWARGTEVGKNVDLSMGKGHITPNRKELA